MRAADPTCSRSGSNGIAVVREYWDMVRAHNLQEFSAANSRLQIPYFNLVYADRHGDIMYLFGGRQPVRSGGTYADWLGILPGDSASAFWTQTLPWSQLPKTRWRRLRAVRGIHQRGSARTDSA